jgi:chromatin segregation and condensation protein Rec8/ScpA/Scc1 (kleisin family)
MSPDTSLGTEEPDSVLRARAALSSTLIAGLELARDGVLALEQGAVWTPVRVRRRDDHEAGLEQPARPA